MPPSPAHFARWLDRRLSRVTVERLLGTGRLGGLQLSQGHRSGGWHDGGVGGAPPSPLASPVSAPVSAQRTDEAVMSGGALLAPAESGEVATEAEVVARLASPTAREVAALGLAMQRILELTHAPNPIVELAATRLQAAQRDDGLFGPSVPDPGIASRGQSAHPPKEVADSRLRHAARPSPPTPSRAPRTPGLVAASAVVLTAFRAAIVRRSEFGLDCRDLEACVERTLLGLAEALAGASEHPVDDVDRAIVQWQMEEAAARTFAG